MENAQRRPHPLMLPIKMIWLSIAMILAFQLMTDAFSKHYKVMIDDQDNRCIPEYSVYFLSLDYDVVEKGKIYAFKASGLAPFFKDGQPMGKYAIAIEGDEIVQNEQGVFVNGELKLKGYPVLDNDKLTIKPETLYKNYTLKSGEIFFAGTAERSYDSRYWGVAQQSQVLGEAYPLW